MKKILILFTIIVIITLSSCTTSAFPETVCPNEHKLGEGVIKTDQAGVEYIKYMCQECYSDVDVYMPEDFAFTIRFGFEGNYNSATGELKNGYNEDLKQECKTTLRLSNHQLLEIYQLLYDVEFTNLPSYIKAEEDIADPTYTLYFTYKMNEKETKIIITGELFVTDYKWQEENEFGQVYYKIVNEYKKHYRIYFITTKYKYF